MQYTQIHLVKILCQKSNVQKQNIVTLLFVHIVFVQTKKPQLTLTKNG